MDSGSLVRELVGGGGVGGRPESALEALELLLGQLDGVEGLPRGKTLSVRLAVCRVPDSDGGQSVAGTLDEPPFLTSALLDVTSVVKVLRAEDALAFQEPTVEIFVREDLLAQVLNAFADREMRSRPAATGPTLGLAELQEAIKTQRLLIKGRQMALLALRGVLKKAFAKQRKEQKRLARTHGGALPRMTALEEEAAVLKEEILALRENQEVMRAQLEALAKQPPYEPSAIVPIRFRLAFAFWIGLAFCIALGAYKLLLVGAVALVLYGGLRCIDDNGLTNRAIETFIFISRLVLSLRLTKFKVQRLRQRGYSSLADDLWACTHTWWAYQVHVFCVGQGGLWLKVGQFLSARADVLPEQYVQGLCDLQDKVPSVKLEVLKKVICPELRACGIREPEHYFASLEEDCLGSASIAQVHRGTTKEGNLEVAVKVKKPGVDALFKLDCLALLYLARLGKLLDRDVDFVRLAETFARATAEELDFRFEAESMRKVRHTLARPLPHLVNGVSLLEQTVWPVEVPRMILSSKSLVVMEYKQGVNVSSMLDDTVTKDEREKLCRSLCVALAKQVFIGGCVNCDSHPGNILVDRRVTGLESRGFGTSVDRRSSKRPPTSGTSALVPILLDFGNCTTVSNDVRLAFAKLVYCVSARDSAGVRQALDEYGFKTEGVLSDPCRILLALRFFLRDTAPPAEAINERRKYMRWSRAERKQRKEKGMPSKLKYARLPDSFMPIIRAVNLFVGLCSRFDQRVKMLRILGLYARQAVLMHEIECQMRSPSRSVSESLGGRGSVGLSPGLTSPVRTGESPVVSCVKALLDNLLQGELASTYMNHNDVTASSGNSHEADALACRAGSSSVCEGLDPPLLGVQVCAMRRRECLLSVSAGRQGPLDYTRVGKNSLFPMLSASRGILALTVHRLVAEGVLDLDVPVCTYWPEFGEYGDKERITVGQLTEGNLGLLKQGIRHEIAPAVEGQNSSLAALCDWRRNVDHVAKTAVAHPVGQASKRPNEWLYGWALGGLIENATGESLSAVLHDILTKPLGIEDELFLGIPDSVSRTRLVSTEDTTWGEDQQVGSEEDAMHYVEVMEERGLAQGFPERQLTSHGWLLDPRLMDNAEVARTCLPSRNGRCTAYALCEVLQSIASSEVTLELPDESGTLPQQRPETGATDSRQRFMRYRESVRQRRKVAGDTEDLAKTEDVLASHSSSAGRSRISHDPFGSFDDRCFFSSSLRSLLHGSEHESMSGVDVVYLESFDREGPRRLPALVVSSDTVHGLCIPSKGISIAMTWNKLGAASIEGARKVVQYLCMELAHGMPL